MSFFAQTITVTGSEVEKLVPVAVNGLSSL